AYEFSEVMTAQIKTADSYKRSAQAKAMADSGIYYAAAVLANPDAFTNTLNSNPFNNPTAFQGKIVQPSDTPRFQGRFSIIAQPDPDNPAGTSNGQQSHVFGVNDESGKINFNALMQIDSSGQVLYNILTNMNIP